jgi:hypothetical protein
MLALIVAGYALWTWHARAWDLGGRSPVLSFDAAQYTVAARELAVHGRLATTFVPPVELASIPPRPGRSRSSSRASCSPKRYSRSFCLARSVRST